MSALFYTAMSVVILACMMNAEAARRRSIDIGWTTEDIASFTASTLVMGLGFWLILIYT